MAHMNGVIQNYYMYTEKLSLTKHFKTVLNRRTLFELCTSLLLEYFDINDVSGVDNVISWRFFRVPRHVYLYRVSTAGARQTDIP